MPPCRASILIGPRVVDLEGGVHDRHLLEGIEGASEKWV